MVRCHGNHPHVGRRATSTLAENKLAGELIAGPKSIPHPASAKGVTDCFLGHGDALAGEAKAESRETSLAPCRCGRGWIPASAGMTEVGDLGGRRPFVRGAGQLSIARSGPEEVGLRFGSGGGRTAMPGCPLLTRVTMLEPLDRCGRALFQLYTGRSRDFSTPTTC